MGDETQDILMVLDLFNALVDGDLEKAEQLLKEDTTGDCEKYLLKWGIKKNFKITTYLLSKLNER